MKILFLGDVVGKVGRDAVVSALPQLREEYRADFVIVNGENSAHGKGITDKIYREMTSAGADVITLGNHAFSMRQIADRFDLCPDLVRPANMEPIGIGRCFVVKEVCGRRVAVANVMGSVFMDCAIGSPYEAMENLLKEIRADIILVDFHAEATGEKQIFLRAFADRLCAVLGTHTHVQTADEMVYHGCAFMADVGMCGAYDSILGRDAAEVLERTLHGTHTHYTPGEGEAVVCGCLIEIDDTTNRAVAITRIQKRP